MNSFGTVSRNGSGYRGNWQAVGVVINDDCHGQIHFAPLRFFKAGGMLPATFWGGKEPLELTKIGDWNGRD